MKVVYTPVAKADLALIKGYVSADSGERQAERLIQRLLGFIDSLALFPLRGKDRSDLLPGLRSLGYRRLVNIAFTVRADRVNIIRIAYRGRDFEMLLSEMEWTDTGP